MSETFPKLAHEYNVCDCPTTTYMENGFALRFRLIYPIVNSRKELFIMEAIPQRELGREHQTKASEAS